MINDGQGYGDILNDNLLIAMKDEYNVDVIILLTNTCELEIYSIDTVWYLNKFVSETNNSFRHEEKFTILRDTLEVFLHRKKNNDENEKLVAKCAESNIKTIFLDNNETFDARISDYLSKIGDYLQTLQPACVIEIRNEKK